MPKCRHAMTAAVALSLCGCGFGGKLVDAAIDAEKEQAALFSDANTTLWRRQDLQPPLLPAYPRYDPYDITTWPSDSQHRELEYRRAENEQFERRHSW